MTNIPDELVQEILDKMERLRVEYASAKGRRTGLEKGRESEIALLIRQRARENNVEGRKESQEATRNWALASETYRRHLAELEEAVKREAELDWALKIEEIRFEAWRTCSANVRIR